MRIDPYEAQTRFNHLPANAWATGKFPPAAKEFLFGRSTISRAGDSYYQGSSYSPLAKSQKSQAPLTLEQKALAKSVVSQRAKAGSCPASALMGIPGAIKC